MLDNKGFDLWANEYDKSVQLSEENHEYPFAGYKDVLNTIYNIIHEKEKAKILDIGFGTGVLTKKLYDDGYEIYGIDFSKSMIEIAKEKMPMATLISHDILKGLPKELEGIQFDYIISTYAIHHLTDEDKVRFIKVLEKYLHKEGKIIIGDISFKTSTLLDECKKGTNEWDDDEDYIVFDELKNFFPQDKISFTAISFCGGILQLIK